jgi:3-oxoacyl-[acyl-carrier-protein] synthase II
MVTPLACGVEATWQRLLEGKSGARRIESFDVSDLATKIACQVPRGDGAGGSFNPDQWMGREQRVDDFIIFAMSAATQAAATRWKQAGRSKPDWRADRWHCAPAVPPGCRHL